MTEKIVLIGAGSAVFTRKLVADLVHRQWDVELGLVDTDPDALQVAERLAQKICDLGARPIRISASTDRREILPDATVVITTIGVGGRRAWERDVVIPRKYGIFQPVGDTVMPGGTSRVLRMAPAIAAIAKDVLALAPEALFFNYANPMSAVCRAVHKGTGAPVIGLCHGVPGTATYLANVLGVPADTLRHTALGINHLTWFTELADGERDLMPKLLEEAQRRLAEPADNPFSWHLCSIFGAFPAVLDRHVAEFFPQFFPHGAYYGKTLGVDVFSVEDTLVGGDKSYERMRQDAFSPDPLPADYLEKGHGEGEQVMAIIANIRQDDGTEYSANLPNTGQIPNLARNAVVESPTNATGGTLQAIQQEPMAPGLAGSLATRFEWVETVVDAALEGSRDKFIQALIIDGAIDSLDTATKLADELLAAQADYLPQF